MLREAKLPLFWSINRLTQRDVLRDVLHAVMFWGRLVTSNGDRIYEHAIKRVEVGLIPLKLHGQIIGSWLFLNWICLIVTIFLEFFADGSSQRIRQLFPNIRVLECQIGNRFPFFSAQIYHDRFRLIMKRAERFNATTRVNNYHFSFGAWTFK